MEDKNQLINVLVELGLKPQEAKVYFACLKLGQSTVGKIADEADVQRTFVYDILDILAERGIVSLVEIKGVMHYSAVSIERFREMQKEKLKKFEKVLPEFKALEMTVGDRPRVQFFEGIEGVFSALSDTLNLPIGGEILAYATGTGLYEKEVERSYEYLKRRIKRKIFSRVIAPDTVGTRKFTDNDKEQLRETTLVSSDRFGFTNEINIYANKMLVMSLQGELLAVIIESESVAKTQRMIFELAWIGAGKYQKK